MRALSNALASELARRDGAVVRMLLQLTPKSGVTRFLAVEALPLGADDYDAELLDISPMYESIDGLTDLTIEVARTAANLAAVELAADAELYTWAEGVPDAEKDLLFRGDVSDPLVISGGSIRFDLVSRANRHDRLIGKAISVDDYPSADPDDVGRIANEIYGSHTDVPCAAIDAGALEPLSEDLAVGATTVKVSDNSRFPASGTGQVDLEEFTYTGKSGTTDLTGVTRNTNGAGDVAHDKGALVAEIKTQYDYLVANHPVKAITNVKVAGVLQAGADFSVLLDDGGVAKIRFTTLPTLQRSVDIEIDDQIGVSDTIGVSSTTTAERSASHAASTTLPLTLETDPDPVEFERSTYNGTVTINCPAVLGTPISQIVTVQFTEPVLTVGSFANDDEVWVQAAPGSGGSFQTLYYVKVGGGVEAVTGNTAIFQSSSNSVRIRLQVNAANSITMETTIVAVRKSYTFAADVDTTRSGEAAKTGTVTLSGDSVADTVIGGEVTCDVDGWADDASGTITGTPDALIERPDHIVRHLLETYGDAPASEVPAADFAAFIGEALAVRIDNRIRVRELLREIAAQTRAVIHYSGGRWRMTRRPDPLPAADITLEAEDVIREEDGRSTWQESRVGLRQVVNRHVWRAGLEPDGAWLFSAIKDALQSQTDYGLREESVDLAFIRDEIQAQALIDWLSARQANPERKVIDVQAAMTAYRIEVGDVARLNDARLSEDVTGEVVAIGPRVLSGRGAGSMQLSIEVP